MATGAGALHPHNLELLGKEGAEALKELRILIVGVGGLGSFAALELAYLGAGRLMLVDNDRVSPSNLNRQVLYGASDVGKSKVLVAAKKLRQINPALEVEAFDARLTKANGAYLVERADVVFDCTDNFESKRLLNLLCYKKRKPLISGAVGGWEGWVATFPFHKEDESVPCLECLFPGDLETLREISEISGPTLVTTVAAVANFQVTELLKLLTQKGETLEGKTLIVDTKNYQCVPVRLTKNPSCSVCS
ncbi:MAG: HesA/MoeB/ThiF family protein [Aquificae bacterium]|nr:HesA/MoeB/ThiF family protein [Aquificota bacterium]